MGILDDRNNLRLKTSLKFKDAPLCTKCPARLYQKTDDVVRYGKGNMIPEYMFVLPKHAIICDAYEELLNEVCKDIVNVEEQYITYHEKCTSNADAKKHCIQYLFHEIRKINPKKIIFFGIDIPEQLCTDKHNAFVFKLYDLYSIIHDKKNKDIIRNKLKEIL